jgi:hypothetical protein
MAGPPTLPTFRPQDPLGDQLFQARLKANDFVQEHLKTIVTIASGTLVLTVSFVKDIVGGAAATAAHWSSFLAISWVCLGLAVFCGTFGLATLVNNLDDIDMGRQNGRIRAFSAGKKWIVRKWVLASIIFFALGIGALAAFGARNYSLFINRTKEKPPVTSATTTNPARFVIASTPEHGAPGHRFPSHTFLLDQTTGQVWQMACTKGHLVTFSKISVEGLPLKLPAPNQTQPDQPPPHQP